MRELDRVIGYESIKAELYRIIDIIKNPEKYKTLVVRVAGYSALFTTLSRSLQDDIINRTEQGF